jgi:hypothetical protein
VLQSATSESSANTSGKSASSSRQHVVVDKCSMLPGIKWQCLVADVQNSFLLQIRTPDGPGLNEPIPIADILESNDTDHRVLLQLPAGASCDGCGGHFILRLQGRRPQTSGSLAFEISVCVSHLFVDMSGLGLIAGSADILSDELEIVPSPSYNQANRFSSWSFIRPGMIVTSPTLPMIYNDYVNSTPAPVVLNGDIDSDYRGLTDGCCLMLPDQGGVWSDSFDVDDIGSIHTVSVPLKSGHMVDVVVEISAGHIDSALSHYNVLSTHASFSGPSELAGAILATARPKSLLINMSGFAIDVVSAVVGAAAFMKLESGHCCNLLGRASNARGMARVRLSSADPGPVSAGGGSSTQKADFSEGAGVWGWSGVFEVLSAGDV